MSKQCHDIWICLFEAEDSVEELETEGAVVVGRRHKHHLNQPASNGKDCKKDKKKKKQSTLSEVVQRLPEVSAKVWTSLPNSAYAEMIAFTETNEVAPIKKKI